ncbi:MAG: serine/threonine protein kinase [Planctomycetes bacterium]|nr:serine/threonine protein kinase [Planctomycetota bacterium]
MINCPRCGKKTATSPCDACQGAFRLNASSTAAVVKADSKTVAEAETKHFNDLAAHERLERDPKRLIGSTSLGGYHFDSSLQQGGMGHTWRAHRVSDQAPVVIKAPRWQDGDAQLRFTREARALASCQSPYILGLIDIDMSSDHQPLLILQSIDGGNLREAFAKADMTAPEFERMTCHIARAIDHCHRRGIIHRDIKPENIMVDDEQYILIDFSLALVGAQEAGPVMGGTPRGCLLGTPPYAAPEQLRQPSQVCNKADIYSFGILLRECLEHCRLETFPRYRLKQWAHLIQSLCHHKQDKRPELQQVLHHCQIFSIQKRNVSTQHNRDNKSPFLIGSILATIIACSFIVGILLFPLQQQQQYQLQGEIDVDRPDILKLNTQGMHDFIITPLENTRIRLPGSGKWRRSPIHLSNYHQRNIELQIIDSDGFWDLSIHSH